ncbi:MAG: hypothetical protein IAF02_25200, partial [Anaerolineae bacterium]|nr:hypothetical protein [Anaerolineae bacterium]
MKDKLVYVCLILLIGLLAACGSGGDDVALVATAVATTSTNNSDICALIPADSVSAILGRDLVSAPAA